MSVTASLSGFCTRACFCRIAPATRANAEPLETATNRWVPMGCGPNVDQAWCASRPFIVPKVPAGQYELVAEIWPPNEIGKTEVLAEYTCADVKVA
jgi:hypothetical protein